MNELRQSCAFLAFLVAMAGATSACSPLSRESPRPASALTNSARPAGCAEPPTALLSVLPSVVADPATAKPQARTVDFARLDADCVGSIPPAEAPVCSAFPWLNNGDVGLASWGFNGRLTAEYGTGTTPPHTVVWVLEGDREALSRLAAATRTCGFATSVTQNGRDVGFDRSGDAVESLMLTANRAFYARTSTGAATSASDIVSAMVRKSQ